MKEFKLHITILICICFFSFCKKNNKINDPPIIPNPTYPTYQPQQQAYYNLFNRTSGWIGGDAAYSIAITSQKVLWLFGDSFNGSIVNNKRTNAVLSAHNTIAIQDGTDPSSASLNYYFGNGQSSFFIPDDNVGFLWPIHGTMINSELYIFFVQVDPSSSSLFTKSKLIKVSNPLAPPTQWQMIQYTVPHSFFSSTKQTLFGSYIIQKDGYAYIFGTETDNSVADRYLMLGRVKLDSITNFSSWHFYSQGQWTTNAADRLTNKIGFELSVSFLPQKNKFALVYSDQSILKNINVQYADSLWGNWTAPLTIYQCPEGDWGSNILCYAAKGHPELSTPNELIITYATNSYNVNDVLNDARLYWPRFIKVSF